MASCSTMPHDSPPPEPICRKRPIGGGPLVAVALPLLLAGYVLSMGPSVWLTLRGQMPPTVYNTVYAPVTWFANHNESFRKLLLGYLRCWEPVLDQP